MAEPDRHLQTLVVPSLFAACVLTACANPTMPGGMAQLERANIPVPEIPEELLLDVGIAVFGVPDPVLDGDDEGSVYQNDQVLRAERNYLPYVIGQHVQATDTWGAVRVVPRRSAAVDVTVTGVITHSDGETLAFRAQATDARGVEWFDREYRGNAEPGAYDTDADAEDPFARAYAALAADMAASLRELSTDDLTRIRAVAELAFARSLAPEAFESHVTPNAEGGHELRRLPADDDPILERVREIRHREHLFIDHVNDYYDDFTANIRGPYDAWRREAFRSRRAHRELKVKADAQVLLGSARIIAGLARMDHDLPGRLGFDWITRGMGLIRGAESSEGQIRDNAESLRDVGSSTEAGLMPHTTALENRTTRLQEGVDSRYDGLRLILNRLYRAEFGIPPASSQPSSAVTREQPADPTSARTAEDLSGPLADDSLSIVASTARGSRLERRTSDAREQIRAGKAQEAIDMLSQILREDEDLGAAAGARVYTLLALGHFAQSDDRQAVNAFNQVVGAACSTICPLGAPRTGDSDKRRHYNPLRPAMHRHIAAVQEEIYYGDFGYAIEMLTDVVGDPLGASQSKGDPSAMKTLGVFSLRPAERAALYQALARAYVGKKDYVAATEVYEKILGMGTKAPPWHRDISNESLAMIHFTQRDYKESLKYQRDWLGTSAWVGEACPKVCPSARLDSQRVDAGRPAPSGTGIRSSVRQDTQSDSEKAEPVEARVRSGPE